MLNFIYWPISAILWFWHKVFSFVLDPDLGITWVLAIVFLTFTIKAIMFKPTQNQLRSGRKMQEMQPKMAEIRTKYKNDQQKMMEETRKIQKEMGVNPVLGCLPMLVQIPVFIGLFRAALLQPHGEVSASWVCPSGRTTTPRTTSSVSTTSVPSYARSSVSAVLLHLHAAGHVHGVQPVDFTRTDIIMVAAPLAIIIAVATHFRACPSTARRRASPPASEAPVR